MQTADVLYVFEYRIQVGLSTLICDYDTQSVKIAIIKKENNLITMKLTELNECAPVQISSTVNLLWQTQYFLRKKRKDWTYIEIDKWLCVLGTAVRQLIKKLENEGWTRVRNPRSKVFFYQEP